MDNRKQSYISLFFMYLAASLLVGLPFALMYGVRPKSITGWIIVFLCGLPSIILGEYIGERLFSDKISRDFYGENEDKLITIRRMAYALLVGIITAVLVVMLSYLLREHLSAHLSIKK